MGRVESLTDSSSYAFTTHSQPSISPPAYSPPWLDRRASDNFYRYSDVFSSPSFSPSPHSPTDVILPNNTTISSVATASTSIGAHTFPVHVFNNPDLHHSLQSVATFTNDLDGSVLFDKYGATIRNATGAIVNYSPKDPTARIWTFNTSAPSIA